MKISWLSWNGKVKKLMRMVEFIHEHDHPDTSNLDCWLTANSDWQTRKIRVYQTNDWPDASSFDLLVLHGGTQHLWDKNAAPWLYKEVEFVRETLQRGCPVLGFCLGSQLLVEALGGEVYQAEKGEIGWFEIQLRFETADHPLLAGLPTGFATFLWHSDHYSLPEDCDSLAFTVAAPHQIVAGRTWPAVGFQFHPEYSLQIIRDYFEFLDEAELGHEIDFPSKKVFLADLEKRAETYPLFERLMNNVIGWFRSAGYL
jgi:GMP synthase (glutamine-hydrolysing)